MPADPLIRLTDALDRLVAEESIAAAELDFPALASIQERLGAVLGRLADPALGAVRSPAVKRCLARRDDTRLRLAERCRGVRGELQRLQQARARVQRVAPVYGAPRRAAASQLSSAA